jgi:site-specific recombinase XerC
VTDLAPVLQGFFTDRLARQKKASPNTVAAYRDTCRLLLAFAQGKTGKAPRSLSLADLDAALIGEFLQHLEEQRGNGSATRNARLAAVHSLFKYAAPRAPEHAAVISQVLAIPPRRRERAIVSYLTPEEADALVAASGRETWHGRRDHALLLLDVQTSVQARTSAATARAARTGPPPSPPRPSGSSGPGSPSSAPIPPARCSPPSPAAGSPATPSKGSSPSTRPRPQIPARQ